MSQVTYGWRQKVGKRVQEQSSLAAWLDTAPASLQSRALCLANSKALSMCLSEHESGMKRDSGQTSWVVQ